MLINPADDAGIEILNGDFSAGAANWNLGDGWAVVAAKAVFSHVVVPGELSTDALGMVPGNVYTIAFDISDIVPAPPGTTDVIMRLGDAASAAIDTNGTKSITLTYLAGPDSVRFEVSTVNPGEGLKIDNVSIISLGDYVSAVLDIRTMTPKALTFQAGITADVYHRIFCYEDNTNIRILYNLP